MTPDVESMAAALLAECVNTSWRHARDELARARYCDTQQTLCGFSWQMWSRLAQIAIEHFGYLPSEDSKRMHQTADAYYLWSIGA